MHREAWVGVKRTLKDERRWDSQCRAKTVYAQPDERLEVGARLRHLEVGRELVVLCARA